MQGVNNNGGGIFVCICVKFVPGKKVTFKMKIGKKIEIDKNKNLILGGYYEKIISSVTCYNSLVYVSFFDFYAGVKKS
jgi:hypothetical protein